MIFNKLPFAIAIAATVAASTVQAATPGFYLGVQAGSGRAEEKGVADTFQAIFDSLPGQIKENYTASYSKTEGGLSGRIFAGYNFNRYFGLEAGYSRIASNQYSIDIQRGKPAIFEKAKLSLQTDVVDVVGKGYLPLDLLTDTLSENLSLYGKAGLAYVNHKGETLTSVTDIPPSTTNETKSTITPVLGVGASYNFTKEIAMDVSWTHIKGKGDNLETIEGFQNYSPAVNVLALGVTYNFS